MPARLIRFALIAFALACLSIAGVVGLEFFHPELFSPEILTTTSFLIIGVIQEYLVIVGYVTLATIIAAALYWVIRGQDRQTIKKRFFIFLGTSCMLFLLTGVVVHARRPEYGQCEQYTKELNGGVKVFHGKIYTVKMCGANFYDVLKWGDNSGIQIRLQVFNEHGNLLVRRYFSFYTNSASERNLFDGDNAIIYQDNASEHPGQLIYMPPTIWDWIRARLPLF